MLIRLKETVSKESSNKDKKNQPKGYKQSSMKNVTRKRYFKRAEYQQNLILVSTLEALLNAIMWPHTYHVIT